MRVMSLALVTVLALVLVGCGDNDDAGSNATSNAAVGVSEPASVEARPASGSFGVPAPSVAPQAPPRSSSDDASSPGDGSSGALDLQVAGRQVIRTASLTVRVELDGEVSNAADRAALIAESRGGFIEFMSVSAGDEHQRASLVLRVPQSAFRDVVSELAGLGDVLDQSQGSQDVSGDVIDLEARERTLRTQEARLLELLTRAEDLDQVLIIERELTRIRTQIEQLAGQLSFLERRVELSTVTLELLGPAANTTAPPSASLTLEASRVEDKARRVQDAARQLDGMIDEVVIDVADGQVSAFVQVRVPRDNFQSFLGEVERLGTVVAKSVRDPQATEATDGEPDARVSVRFEQADDDRPWPLIGLAAALVAASAAALAVVVIRSRSRRRQSATSDAL